jgi:hypothetical protein
MALLGGAVFLFLNGLEEHGKKKAPRPGSDDLPPP